MFHCCSTAFISCGAFCFATLVDVFYAVVSPSPLTPLSSHPGYFGKVGMRYFHKTLNQFHCPSINVDKLWSLVPAEQKSQVHIPSASFRRTLNSAGFESSFSFETCSVASPRFPLLQTASLDHRLVAPALCPAHLFHIPPLFLSALIPSPPATGPRQEASARRRRHCPRLLQGARQGPPPR